MRRPSLCHLLALCILWTGSADAFANLRPPYVRAGGLGGELRRVPGLVLHAERLSITFEGTSTGKLATVMAQQQRAQIRAVYRVAATDTRTATFDFVAGSQEAAEARVNGVARPVQVVPQAGGDPAEGFTLRFEAAMRAGMNDIEVTYRQPLAVQELSHGYFRRSRWRSSLDYAFWPLKAWERTVDFKAEVILTLPRRGLFGPEIMPVLEGRIPRGTATPLPGRLERQGGHRILRVVLGPDPLPDLLSAAAEER